MDRVAPGLNSRRERAGPQAGLPDRGAVLIGVRFDYCDNHTLFENMLENATYQGQNASSRKESTAWSRFQSIRKI
jgi:hypothetical protein